MYFMYLFNYKAKFSFYVFFNPLYSKGWKHVLVKAFLFVSISTENIKAMKKTKEIM